MKTIKLHSNKYGSTYEFQGLVLFTWKASFMKSGSGPFVTGKAFMPDPFHVTREHAAKWLRNARKVKA